jgi:uncharacterized protein HemY
MNRLRYSCRSAHHFLRLLLFFILPVITVISCASAPKKNDKGHISASYEAGAESDASAEQEAGSSAAQSGAGTESEAQQSSGLPDLSQAVSIALPPKKARTYFSNVDQTALAAVENGSPDSLRTAASKLRHQTDEYADNEKVLLGVAGSVMQIVWPSEQMTWDMPSVSEQTPYLGAIDSARQGVYDSSTGNSDFLTLVLPSLVLLTSETRDDYYDQARSALDSALKLRQDSVLANYLLGMLYVREKKYSDALGCFTKASSGAPSCIEAAYALALCNFSLKQTAAAYSQASALLATHEQYKPLLKLCAETSFALGDLDNAESYVARVLQQEPENAYYILFRARILVKKGEYIKASSLLDVYARTDTTSREYLMLRAQVQKDWNRNTTAAIATIEDALARYPDDAEIILTAAKLVAGTGIKAGDQSAGQLAEQILARDPKNVDALSIQIAELVREKNWQAAYKSSTDLLGLKNVPSDALFTHITICLSAGKKEEAWRLVSQLYSEKSNDEAVLQQYVKVLIATGRTSEASNLIAKQMPSVSVRMKSFFYYEHSFLVSGEDAVLADLRSSLTANPRNQDALYRLYQIYYDKKEYRKAQYYLKQVVALNPSDENLLKLNMQLESLLSQ